MIKKYTCSNGLRIVYEAIPTVRSAAIGVWIHTGSRYETEENNGISHFLEHMFFKGTKTKSAREIAETFDKIGGQVNAFTSKEYTCYYAKVLDEHATVALDGLSDMFFNSIFDKDELEKEKNVVFEEIKMYEDTPDDIVHDLLSQASYGSHSLGLPILGSEQVLRDISSEQLHDFVRDYYTPENVVVSIAGNLDETFISEVEKRFGSYKNESKVNKQISTPFFYNKSLTRKKDTEQAHLCIGFNGLSIVDEDIYNLIILNNILGGSMSSRLFQEVREQRGLAYSIYSYHTSYQDSGLITIYGGTGNHQLNLLFDTIQETLNQLKNEGITQKELNNSIEQLKGNLMLSLESTNSRMSRNGKNELLLGTHRSLDEMIESINSVNESKVNNLIKNLFNDEYSVSLISSDGKLPF
ncbi:MAG: processing protease [Bacillales bacterium]|nr:processing protease [Bacillales bacterium]